MEMQVCHMCRRKKRVLFRDVGISFSMHGKDMAFCTHCLKSMTAYTFLKTLFLEEGYSWPPKLVRDGR